MQEMSANFPVGPRPTGDDATRQGRNVRASAHSVDARSMTDIWPRYSATSTFHLAARDACAWRIMCIVHTYNDERAANCVCCARGIGFHFEREIPTEPERERESGQKK